MRESNGKFRRITNCDDTHFNTIDSFSAYLIGLIAADSNISQKKFAITIYKANDGHAVVILDSDTRKISELVGILKEQLTNIKKVIYLRDTIDDENWSDISEMFADVKNVEFKSMLKDIIASYHVAQKKAIIE